MRRIFFITIGFCYALLLLTAGICQAQIQDQFPGWPPDQYPNNDYVNNVYISRGVTYHIYFERISNGPAIYGLMYPPATYTRIDANGINIYPIPTSATAVANCPACRALVLFTDYDTPGGSDDANVFYIYQIVADLPIPNHFGVSVRIAEGGLVDADAYAGFNSNPNPDPNYAATANATSTAAPNGNVSATAFAGGPEVENLHPFSRGADVFDPPVLINSVAEFTTNIIAHVSENKYNYGMFTESLSEILPIQVLGPPIGLIQILGTSSDPSNGGSPNSSMCSSSTVHFQFRPKDGGPTLFASATLDPDGTFAFPFKDSSGNDIPLKAYNLAIKSDKTLQTVVSIDLSDDMPAFNVTLIGGDANNDNRIDVLDFGILVNAYGTTYDSHNLNNGFDTQADFNYDCAVDVLDFGILVNGYGLVGDP